MNDLVVAVLLGFLLESTYAIPQPDLALPEEYSVCYPNWGNPAPAPPFTADDCALSIQALERSIPQAEFYTQRLFVGQDYAGPEVEGMVRTPKIYHGKRFHLFEPSPCVMVVVNLASLTEKQRRLIPKWPERELRDTESSSWDRMSAAGQIFLMECMQKKPPSQPAPGWVSPTEKSSMAVLFMGKDSEILKEFKDVPVTVVDIPAEFETL